MQDATSIPHDSVAQSGADTGGTGAPEASPAEQAVAQSLAADVLAALAAEDESGLPPGDAWQTLSLSQVPPAEIMRDAPSVAPVMSRDLDQEVELARLERQLWEQAAALSEARAEVEQLRALARDAALRFEALPDATNADPATRAERDRAVTRALEAEAARAEIAFQLDEVMGHLVSLGEGEGALPGELLQTTCARLTGTVRGLLSSRAEAEERRDHAWARSILLEQDLEDAQLRYRLLQRELGEAREREELALSEASVLRARVSGAIDGRSAAALRGELLGLRARRDEAESALGQAVERNSALAAKVASTAQAERGVADRITELSQQLTRETERASEVSARLAEREAESLLKTAELTRAQAELALRDERLEQLLATQGGEAERLANARAGVERLAVERGRLHTQSLEALRELRGALHDLATELDRSDDADANLLGRTEPGMPAVLEAESDEPERA